VLLCINLKTTLAQIEKRILSDEDIALGGFFRSNNYYLHSYEEMLKYNTEEEIKNTSLIADMCNEYDITSPIIIPKFDIPHNETPISYLTKLCREGWKRKEKHILNTIANYPVTKLMYGDRFREEMQLWEETGLSNYFLVVNDIVQYARKNNILVGIGRGSGGSCLTLYLLGVTDTDPLKYNLLLQRFYSTGRNICNHISFDEYPFIKSLV